MTYTLKSSFKFKRKRAYHDYLSLEFLMGHTWDNAVRLATLFSNFLVNQAIYIILAAQFGYERCPKCTHQVHLIQLIPKMFRVFIRSLPPPIHVCVSGRCERLRSAAVRIFCYSYAVMAYFWLLGRHSWASFSFCFRRHQYVCSLNLSASYYVKGYSYQTIWPGATYRDREDTDDELSILVGHTRLVFTQRGSQNPSPFRNTILDS